MESTEDSTFTEVEKTNSPSQKYQESQQQKVKDKYVNDTFEVPLNTQFQELKYIVQNQAKQLKQLTRKVSQLNKEVRIQKQENERLILRLQILERQKTIEGQLSSLMKNIDSHEEDEPTKLEEKEEKNIQEMTLSQIVELQMGKQKLPKPTGMYEFPPSKSESVKNETKRFIQTARDIRMFKFVPHFKHPPNNMFEIEGQHSNILIMKRQTDFNWHNFILKAYLQAGSIYVITIQILRSTKQKIQLGIISQDEFGAYNTITAPSSVTCGMENVLIYRQGIRVSESMAEGMKDGDIVTMRVDRCSNNIEWYKKSRTSNIFSLVGETSIPAEIDYKKRLYIAITFYHYEDMIKVLS